MSTEFLKKVLAYILFWGIFLILIMNFNTRYIIPLDLDAFYGLWLTGFIVLIYIFSLHYFSQQSLKKQQQTQSQKEKHYDNRIRRNTIDWNMEHIVIFIDYLILFPFRLNTYYDRYEFFNIYTVVPIGFSIIAMILIRLSRHSLKTTHLNYIRIVKCLIIFFFNLPVFYLSNTIAESPIIVIIAHIVVSFLVYWRYSSNIKSNMVFLGSSFVEFAIWILLYLNTPSSQLSSMGPATMILAFIIVPISVVLQIKIYRESSNFDQTMVDNFQQEIIDSFNIDTDASIDVQKLTMNYVLNFFQEQEYVNELIQISAIKGRYDASTHDLQFNRSELKSFRLTNEIKEQLSNSVIQTQQINIPEIAKIINKTPKEIKIFLYEMLGEGKLHGKFYGDEFRISSDVLEFVKNLDLEFEKWQNNEVYKTGKI